MILISESSSARAASDNSNPNQAAFSDALASLGIFVHGVKLGLG